MDVILRHKRIIKIITVFNDGKTINAMSAKLKTYAENAMLDDITRQADTDPYTDWGTGLDVLLISDSALGGALGLLIYLSTKTSLDNVRLCMNIEDV